MAQNTDHNINPLGVEAPMHVAGVRRGGRRAHMQAVNAINVQVGGGGAHTRVHKCDPPPKHTHSHTHISHTHTHTNRWDVGHTHTVVTHTSETVG